MQGKVSSNDSAVEQVYAGIDVCKKWLDIAIHPVGHVERFENAAKGHKRLLRHLLKFPRPSRRPCSLASACRL